MPDTTLSTLAQIRTKVRRLTRSMSTSQLSDIDLDAYINTSVLYDFPEHLRLFNQHTIFTFYTTPFVDTYQSSDTVTDPLFNFKNRFISINPPVYIAGNQALYSQSRDEFFKIYPIVNGIRSIGVNGNAVLTTFSGVIGSGQPLLLKGNVLFSSVNLNNAGLSLIDQPLTNNNAIGNLYVPGAALPSTTVQDVTNFINYLTGAFTITFATAPGSGKAINSQTVLVQPSIPQAMLYYNGTITMRPVPDMPYRVSMEVYVRPTELLLANQSPELAQWWQYISYLSAKKIFEDRMDIESVQQIMPELKKQEVLVMRRTIVQNTTQRVSTIFTDELGYFKDGGQY